MDKETTLLEDDNALMSSIAQGDEQAFAKLVKKYLPQTIRIAYRYLGSQDLANDVAQEAFAKIWNYAPKWHATDKNDKKSAKFSTWFYRVVVNLSIDHKRKIKPMANIDNVAEPFDESDTPFMSIQKKEQAQQVADALAKLPDRQRMALILCFYEDCSYKEAAEQMDVTVKALESLLVRGRKELKSILSKKIRG